ncbi:MAG: hypothetical protein K0U98_00600 [Deltaproteobacteria bacterium]|nr:hypothetical protein [Deltaproteobacteria bacterium]
MTNPLDLGPAVEATDVVELKDLATPAVTATAGAFASGWVADSNSTRHTTTIPHNLGHTPNWCQVWFTGNGKQDYLVSWSWSSGWSGNPVTMSANADAVFLEIYTAAPLHGTWNAANNQWATYSTGYWRIVVG